MEKEYGSEFFKEEAEDTTDFSLIKGDTMQQVENLEEELKEKDKSAPFLYLIYNKDRQRLYLFLQKGEEKMQEMKQQKLAFFKKEKEDSNTDFSLVKGALTENINRLEKIVNGDASKYIQGKNLKENA